MMDLLPNSMSFRFVSTLDLRVDDMVPLGFTGRVRRATAGRINSVEWFCRGELDDPEPRTPAYARFRDNGDTKQFRHYRQGRLHNPVPHEPAVVGFFVDGSVKYREHFRYGRRHDSGNEAAITKWRNDGSVRATHNYYEGMRIERIQRPLAS